jgi:hypothetical protein
MQGVLKARNNDREGVASEAGFVLVAAMVVLLALTLFGIWAIRTSTIELDIAGSVQRVEQQFNVAEGAVALEVAKVGFITEDYYQIGDPSITNQILSPTVEAEFDPGGDTAAVPGAVDAADTATWPMQNLLQNNADDEFDYRYLVTYLSADLPPKGYDAGTTSAYSFMIQGMAPMVIEVGGSKIAMKAAF